jgi:hypothetical protein
MPAAEADPRATVESAQSRPSGATKADINRLPRSMTINAFPIGVHRRGKLAVIQAI